MSGSATVDSGASSRVSVMHIVVSSRASASCRSRTTGPWLVGADATEPLVAVEGDSSANPLRLPIVGLFDMKCPEDSAAAAASDTEPRMVLENEERKLKPKEGLCVACGRRSSCESCVEGRRTFAEVVSAFTDTCSEEDAALSDSEDDSGSLSGAGILFWCGDPGAEWEGELKGDESFLQDPAGAETAAMFSDMGHYSLQKQIYNGSAL